MPSIVARLTLRRLHKLGKIAGVSTMGMSLASHIIVVSSITMTNYAILRVLIFSTATGVLNATTFMTLSLYWR